MTSSIFNSLTWLFLALREVSSLIARFCGNYPYDCRTQFCNSALLKVFQSLGSLDLIALRFNLLRSYILCLRSGVIQGDFFGRTRLVRRGACFSTTSKNLLFHEFQRVLGSSVKNKNFQSTKEMSLRKCSRSNFLNVLIRYSIMTLIGDWIAR